MSANTAHSSPHRDFVQAVVDQKISLWDLSTDDGSFSEDNSGMPLSALLPVDDDH